MESNYSNRMLDMKFEALTEKIKENHKETMERIDLSDRKNQDKHIENTNRLEKIEQQTTATNGRVRKLEKWQSGIVMAGAVAIFLGGVIISLVVYIYQYQLVQEQARINSLKEQVQKTSN